MNTLRGIDGRNFTYSEEDHLMTAGDIQYEYNIDGFLAIKANGTNITNYAYSSRGELLRVNLPDGRVIEYTHDPLGRRIDKRINGTIVEKYLWQNMTRLLAVYDGANNLLMRFKYADDRMPVEVAIAGVTYYLVYDQVGSLRLVANSAGNVIKRIDYDSFGNIIDETNEALNIPFGFAGGLHDRDTGFVRFGYRDYDPDVGRWTAKDPIFFTGGDTDLYGYVLNNPVSLIDTWGLDQSPVGHLDWFSRSLSVTGGPPAGIDPVPVPWSDYKEAIQEGVVEPLDESINSIPPGTTTGNPYWDIGLNLYQMFRGLYDLFENEEKKEKECDQ
jgi:RHS repeat-associated protein